MSIAKRLLEARIKAGMSQADLAEKVGVSQQSIQKNRIRVKLTLLGELLTLLRQ